MCEGSLNSTLGHEAVRIHMNAKLQLVLQKETLLLLLLYTVFLHKVHQNFKMLL